MNKEDKGIANSSFIEDKKIDGNQDGYSGDHSTSEGKESTSEKDPKESDVPKTASEAFDRILNSVGGFGLWQWKICLLCGFCGLFTSMHNLGAVFLAASPDHWCKIPSVDLNSTISKELRNFTIPWVVNKDGVMSHSKCRYFDEDYTNYSTFEGFREIYHTEEIDHNNTDGKYCDSWHYDDSIYASTLVTDWDLVCNRRWLMPVTQASYMFGILMGAVVTSAFSDKIGRRKATLGCTVIFFISSLGAAFSNSFEMFLVLRFFTAAAGQGMYLVNFVLLMETSQGKGRTVLPTLYGINFVTGSCLLPLIAYFLNEWRKQQLATGSATALLFIYFWLFPESPRWLLMQNRFDEGLKVLETIAESNGGALPPTNILNSQLKVISEEGFKSKKYSNWKKILELFENLFALVRTPNLRRRNLTIFYAWFVVSSVYYGLTFSGYNLNVSIYWLVFLVSVVGYPVAILQIFFMNRFGRRITLALCFLICGASCLIILTIPNEYSWVNMTLVVIGRAMAGAAFTVVFIYSSELVPTNIRNLSMGIASMWGRIGSIISPFVVDLLGEIYYAIPSTVFGFMTILAGLLTFLLPETGFTPLPESVQEIESLPR